MSKPTSSIRHRWSPFRRLLFGLRKSDRRSYRLFKTFPNFDYQTIVDIGAYQGEFTDSALALLEPKRVVLVEADPGSAKQLSLKYQASPKCEVVHCAISNVSQPVMLRVNVARDSSSILPITDRAAVVFGKQMHEVEEVEVPGMTLNDLFNQSKLDKVDLLKVDIQGAERMMIEGGKEAIKRVKAMYIEVSFEEFYEGCALFKDFDSLLNEHGFKLRSFHESRLGADGCMAYANALYLNVNA